MMIWKLCWIIPGCLLAIATYLWYSQNTTTWHSKQVTNSAKERWQLVPGSIYDGDTLRLTRNGVEEKIRFCGIDAPEKNQPLGIESRDYLRSLVAHGELHIGIVPVERDKYKRLVAELFVTQQGKQVFLNSEMVAAGMAYHYQQYSGNCPNREAIAQAEEKAKSSRLGVWDGGDYQRPWEYRRSRR